MRTVPTIDYSEAKRVVDLIVEKASQMQKAVVVAVADSHGELICFARMDGASVCSIAIAMNKAWTAARAGKPTQEIGEKVRHPEKGHDIVLAALDAKPLLDLGLRLGEGTGALLAVPLVRAAARLLTDVADLSDVLAGNI